MHSLLSRANAVFAFTLSVLAGMTFCCFLTTVMEDFTAPVTLDSSKVLVKNLPDYSAARENHDLGFVNYDVQVDVSPLFNWNVKQLFLYLTAEYSSANNPLNQVVLWDKIIRRGEQTVVDVKAGNPKYYFWDDGHGLMELVKTVYQNSGQKGQKTAGILHIFPVATAVATGKMCKIPAVLWSFRPEFCGNDNVTLILRWNVIPNAGSLPLVDGEGSHRFSFPSEYASARAS